MRDGKKLTRDVLIHGTARRLIENHPQPADTLSDKAICEAIEGEIGSWGGSGGRMHLYYMTLSERGVTRLIKDIRKDFSLRWTLRGVGIRNY